MHNLSFESKNPVFEYSDLHFSVQVFTFQNLYELDAKQTEVTEIPQGIRVEAHSLTWAGGQKICCGEVAATAKHSLDRYVVKVNAKHSSERIRCVKLTIHNVPRGKNLNLRGPEHSDVLREIPDEGEILRYPNGFDGLITPLIVLENPTGGVSWFRALDSHVLPKTFALIPKGNACDVELIYEQSARAFAKDISVPAWEIGFHGNYDEIMKEQMKNIEESFHLHSWEARPDVPTWAKKIALVAAIHCQHWTGYTFNTYDQVIRNLEKLAQMIEPERVLVYLPGWEGRYYFNYGEYRPSEDLGGEKGFQLLNQKAKELGMHVMPMFMINGANPHLEDFPIWGASSYYQNASGFPVIWGSCDWDTSRHYDHNCGFPMNPGAPLWQDHLVGQIVSLIDQYHFEAVFLDLAAIYSNDRRFDVYEGTIQIANRIRKKHPEVLISGEGWYDAMSAAFPLTQPSLTLDGDTRWSDRPYEEIFSKYNRCFGHLGTGDLSRGSTGVFEFGKNQMTQTVPLRKGIIPTLTIVDGTIEHAQDKVMKVIEQANRYVEMFL